MLGGAFVSLEVGLLGMAVEVSMSGGLVPLGAGACCTLVMGCNTGMVDWHAGPPAGSAIA